MQTSIFQERNLKTPEEVFNFLGNQQFGKEWTERPLQILQGLREKPKPVSKVFLRNKYMADQTFKKLSQFVKGDDVTIYAPSKAWDEEPDCGDIDVWKPPHFRISAKDFLLIEQEMQDGYGGVDMTRRCFWIEMPKELNPLSHKKAGRRPKHNKDYLKSILPEVRKLVRGKVTERSLANAYKDYLKDGSVGAPSKTWIGNNLDAELKRIREEQ